MEPREVLARSGPKERSGLGEGLFELKPARDFPKRGSAPRKAEKFDEA
jgi:hypothetical protein